MQWADSKGIVVALNDQNFTVRKKPLLYSYSDSTEFYDRITKQVNYDDLKKLRYDVDYPTTIVKTLGLTVIVGGIIAYSALALSDWSSLSFGSF